MKQAMMTIGILMASFSVLGQTQTELNQGAQDRYDSANIVLNNMYDQILVDYEEDTVFLKALRKAQHTWIQFRDAELKMKYPPREPGWYGSNHNMCILLYKTELTNSRIETLKNWLVAEEEGDGCAGSVNPKN